MTLTSERCQKEETKIGVGEGWKNANDWYWAICMIVNKNPNTIIA